MITLYYTLKSSVERRKILRNHFETPKTLKEAKKKALELYKSGKIVSCWIDVYSNLTLKTYRRYYIGRKPFKNVDMIKINY